MPRRLSRSTHTSARHGRTATGLGIALVATLLFAACTAGPSTRPAIVQQDQPGAEKQQQRTHGKDPRSLPPLEKAPENSIDWKDCDSDTSELLDDHSGVPDDVDFSCAGVITSSQSSEPGGDINRIHVLRAGDGKVPLLVLNDVDGAPGSVYAARLAARMPDDVLKKFSLIGVDRRGTGESDPIDCIPDEVRGKLLGHDPGSDDVGPLMDAARSAGQRCAIALRGNQGSYDSTHTADDLEQLRSALGVKHLNALSRGESSHVLLSYAQQHPHRVGRFVLNGVPDPSTEIRAKFDTRAKSAAASLKAFDDDCDGDCAFDGDARDAVGDMVQQLRDKPARTDAGFRMGPALALYAVQRGLGQPERWSKLATGIDEATDGDPDTLAEFVEPLLTGTSGRSPRLDAAVTTMCNDTTARPPVDRINTLLDKLQDNHSLFGGLAGQQLAWCSPWKPRDKPIDPAEVSDVPPMVATSSAADPTVPEKGTRRAVEQLPGAALVRWQGAGHGALRSDCVGDAVRDYLLDDVVPSQGTLCPA